MTSPTKRPWQSKVLWWNAITLLIAAVVAIQNMPGVAPAVLPWLGVVNAVGNVALRLITNTGVSLAEPTPITITDTHTPDALDSHRPNTPGPGGTGPWPKDPPAA